MKKIFTLSTFLFLACGHQKKIDNSKIEIYLVTNNKLVDDTTFYFEPTVEQLADTALIKDNEILGYEITADTSKKHNEGQFYSLLLSQSGQNKLDSIKNISLSRGMRFAITVNGQPIYGGYFWSLPSSFSCNWIFAYPQNLSCCKSRKLRIQSGRPWTRFTEEHPDQRDNETLIDAFKNSKRLFED